MFILIAKRLFVGVIFRAFFHVFNSASLLLSTTVLNFSIGVVLTLSIKPYIHLKGTFSNVTAALGPTQMYLGEYDTNLPWQWLAIPFYEQTTPSLAVCLRNEVVMNRQCHVAFMWYWAIKQR